MQCSNSGMTKNRRWIVQIKTKFSDLFRPDQVFIGPRQGCQIGKEFLQSDELNIEKILNLVVQNQTYESKPE
jgi:hypothetical protein